MDKTEIVKEIIDRKHALSNGSCGLNITDLAFKTQLPYTELNPILKQLYDDKYFVLREGINGRMIFKK